MFRAQVIGSGLLPAEQGAGRQHDDQDGAIGTDLPVGRNPHEGQERRGSQRQGQSAQHGTYRRHPSADKLAPAKDDSGDGKEGIAIADIGVGRSGGADQCEAGSDAEHTGEGEERDLGLEQRPAGAAYRQRIAAGTAQDRAIGSAHQADMGDGSDDNRRQDRKWYPGRLQAHELLEPIGCRTARLGQQQNREPLPDEAHAQSDDDRRQRSQVDQSAEGRIHPDRRHQHQGAEQGCLAQPGGGDAADEADEGADREVEVITGHDEQLRNRREGDRDRQVEHQREAEIADGPWIEPGDGDQDEHQRKRRQQRAEQTARRLPHENPQATRFAC